MKKYIKIISFFMWLLFAIACTGRAAQSDANNLNIKDDYVKARRVAQEINVDHQPRSVEEVSREIGLGIPSQQYKNSYWWKLSNNVMVGANVRPETGLVHHIQFIYPIEHKEQ